MELLILDNKGKRSKRRRGKKARRCSRYSHRVCRSYGKRRRYVKRSKRRGCRGVRGKLTWKQAVARGGVQFAMSCRRKGKIRLKAKR